MRLSCYNAANLKSIIICFYILLGNQLAMAAEKHATQQPDIKIATFAGGCFWCMEPPYDNTKGVIKTLSGYAGGTEKNPTYEQVSNNLTSHVEAIQISYDATLVSYETLLDIFWRNIDPFDKEGQFCDKGEQYLAKIFTHDEEQHEAAKKSKQAIQQRFKENSVAVEILPFTTFYPAEDYHQDYYQKNPIRYKIYRYGCGRDKRLKTIWE